MPPAAHLRPEEIERIKAEIRESFHEDPTNLAWSLDKADRLAWSVGPGLYSSLLLLLCNMTMEEDDARGMWERIRARQARLEQALGRPVALRVAAFDVLVGANRDNPHPRILELLETPQPAGQQMIDPCTGLQTGRFLSDQLPREVGRARRFRLDLSYVHLEIDEFAPITERLGRTLGTVLLREVAGIVSGCIRNIDYAARTASAQFALLLTETDRMGAYYVAERIRARVEEFYLERRVGGRPLEVTVSAGVAAFPEDADTGDELAMKACEAYYTARTRGRGRVAIYHRERREYIRLSTENEDLQVTLIPEGAESSAPAAMKNISSGGVLFESDTPIELGRMVHILCRNRREADQVLIPGRVVRIERFESAASTRYEIGVLFDLVVEEQLEGVVEFLERFISHTDGPVEDDGDDPPQGSDSPRAT